MAITIKHKFVSPKSDGTDTSIVRPSNWNDEHDLAGLATGVADFLASPSSANLATAVTDETGSGALVFGTAPTIGNPTISGGTIDNAAIGGTTAAAGAFTSLTSNSTTTLNGTTIPASKTLAVTTDKLSVFAATTSSELAGVISDETGSGALVFATSPALTTPDLGTPSAATLTNATDLPVSTGISGLGTGVATFLGTPSSANLAAAVTDETGSGALVFATSPTLVTPALGTPASATLTNATGLPVSSGISGLGTGVATALAVNVGTAGAPVVNGGALGTPASGTVTNLTGTASININGTVGATTPATGAFTTLTASSIATLNTLTSSGATITGGSVNGTTVGATTPSTGAFTILTADFIYAQNISAVGSFTWNTAASSPAAAASVGSKVVTPVHAKMRRCVLSDAGVVQYYLSASNSANKADGTAADLTGTDGMVMVEIPKFYTRREVSGTYVTWSISAVPLPGFAIHPAFVKDGAEVNFRYYSAYDACAFDVSASTYISGLNRDNAVSNTPNVDVTATTGDKLASVSGVYPMVGLTRAEFRTLAANRGTGWRQLDWTLFSAVQLLYLIEHQSFFSQDILGAGNTAGSYLTQSDDQNQSPHTIAGASNSLGNTSTNTTTGAGVNAKPGTSFMCYRGIENFYGNCWNFADGVIVNPDGTASANQGDWWFTNNSADFSDSVKTNMTQITAVASTAGSGFVSAIAAVDNFFVPTAVSGASSSTYITDQFFGSTSADRVVRVGGGAADGANAGAFVLAAIDAASNRFRGIGGRLAF